MSGPKRVAVFLGLAVLASAAFAAWRLTRQGSPRAAQPAAAVPRFPAGCDIVLVTIDTLRADALGFMGNTRVETPVLDRLAGQGAVFRQAHAHNVVTLPSHANILTGLLPYQHGVRDNEGFRLDPRFETVATLLKAKGYATGAFVGAFPLDSRFGLARGFDVYDDRYPRGKTRLDFEMPERPAPETIAAARRWWDASGDRPRFLWVHLYDCHAPYNPPPPFAERYRDDAYLGEVASVDAALGPLLEPFLSGKAKPALVVMTADHGEARGDHGEPTHGLFCYEATLHVPLVVWSPTRVPAGARDDPARHIDIAPTLLQAAGLPKPANWPGRSLLEPPDTAGPERTYFEAYSTAFNRGWAPLRGVIVSGFKYIDLPEKELYDLAGDPAEQHNLAAADSDRVATLARLVPADSAIGAAALPGPSSANEVSQLRNLGYLSGSAAIKKTYTAADDPKNLVEVDAELHRCVDLYQRGELQKAIDVGRKIVKERPSMSMAYVNLGFLLRRAGQFRQALDLYRDAVERGVTPEELEVQYGLALCESGRAAEALARLAPLSGSRDPDTLNALGIAYSDSGRQTEATDVFRRVLELDPHNVDADTNLGVVRLRLDDPAGARGFFRQALDVDPEFPRAWNGLGVALARLGDERGAVEAWKRAVAADPRLYDALFNLGLTAGKLGLTRDARQALELFVSTAPRAQYGPDIEKARGLLRVLSRAGS